MRVMTLVGTRPEIIRLSRVIAKFDRVFEHTLVHTGQNWDVQLNQVFFEEMNVRRPDVNLNINVASLGSSIAGVISGTEEVIRARRPDAFLVLGDTNSALGLIMAKRMGVQTFHMEAGNRCFDERVPEETNRRLLDHISDFNLVYTEHARRNLLNEGLPAQRIVLTGSPMFEVLHHHLGGIEKSKILNHLGLRTNSYFLVSAHREETVDSGTDLAALIRSLELVAQEWELPVVVSLHPRTRKRLEERGLGVDDRWVRLLPPFGFLDYVHLQRNARCVLSDSGTISEESAILRFPAVTMRRSIERPEAIDVGSIVLSGVEPAKIKAAVNIALCREIPALLPPEYEIPDVSERVASFVASQTSSGW